MPHRDVIVVVQKDDHSLGYFDLDSGDELRRVPLPPYPHEFAVSADGRHAYSCHFGLKLAEDEGPGGNEVSVVDIDAGVRLPSIHCNGWRRLHGVAFDASGGLYVLSEGSSRLLVIPQPESGEIARVLPTLGSGSHMVSVTRDGTRAFCSNMFSGTVSVLFPREKEGAPAVLRVGDRPEGSAFDADERRLLVCNRESASVSVIDVARGEVISGLDTPPGPVRIVHRRGPQFCLALYHDQSVAVVDADRAQVALRVGLPAKPVSVSLDRSRNLALAGLLPSGIAVVDLRSGRLRNVIATRAGPDPMVVLSLDI